MIHVCGKNRLRLPVRGCTDCEEAERKIAILQDQLEQLRDDFDAYVAQDHGATAACSD